MMRLQALIPAGEIFAAMIHGGYSRTKPYYSRDQSEHDETAGVDPGR
jgi:hypothetical protein